ncbi:hypothetical protein GOODEAATRI_019437 [Goodea atripinnis]|uniref:Mitoguardin 1 n=1 Tax=Goodea atripinnis TaxID=208336 RepID=A0ABV0PZR6_9TELE
MTHETLTGSQLSIKAAALRMVDLPLSVYSSLTQVSISTGTKKLVAATTFGTISLLLLARRFKRRKGRKKSQLPQWDQADFKFVSPAAAESGMDLFEEALQRWEEALTFRSRQGEDDASCTSVKTGAGDAIAEQSMEDVISVEFIHRLKSLLQRAYRLQEEFEGVLGMSEPSSRSSSQAVGAQRSEEHFSSGTSSFLRGGAADGRGGQDLLQGASVANGFISHFYAVCEQISPVLAWGFLGPKTSLHDLCFFFKDQVLHFLKDVFDLDKVRYSSVETLAEDMLHLLHRRSELLLAYLGPDTLRPLSGCSTLQVQLVPSALLEAQAQ